MSGSSSTGTNYLTRTIAPTSSWTACGWVKVNAWDKAAFGRVLSLYDSSAALDVGIQQDPVGGTADQMQLYAADSGGTDVSSNIITGTAPTAWYFVAVVLSSGNCDVYWGTESGGTLTHENFTIAGNPNTLDTAQLASFAGSELGNNSYRGWRMWDAALNSTELTSEWYSGTFAPVRTSNLDSDIRIPNGTNPGTATTGGNWTVTGTFSDDASDPVPPTTSGPSLTTLSPLDDATGVNPRPGFSLTFNENVQAGTGNIVLKNDTLGGATIETIDVTDTTRVIFSSTTVTIIPDTTLVYGNSYHWEIASGAIVSSVDAEVWTGISNSTSWNFTVMNMIDFVAAGAGVFSTGGGTTNTPGWPATAAGLGGIDLLFVGMKPVTASTGIISVPESSGFRRLDARKNAGGAGAANIDTGNTDLHVFWRPSSDAITGTFTVTTSNGATNGVSWSKIFRFKTNVGGNIKPVCSMGEQTVTGNISIIFETNPEAWKVRPGDMLLVVFGPPTDVGGYSAHLFTQAGVTFGTLTEQQEWGTTNGYDIGGVGSYGPVLAGRGVDKLTYTATATTTTNIRGPAALIRLRVG